MKKPFAETKVGKFLQTKGFNKVLDIASTAFAPLSALTVVKDLLLKGDVERKLSPEEEKEFMQLYQMELLELDMIIKDVQSARDREVKINQAENASWLVKNIVPILALVYVAFSMTVNILLLVGYFKIDSNIAQQIISGVTGITMLIIGYYFGSSSGSSSKDNTIKRLMTK